MLRRDERRSLEEIERRLIAEDPEWAMGLSASGPGGSRWAFPLRTTLAAIVLGLAVVLLVLGQVGSAFLAAALAGAVLLSRMCRLEA